jgi:hypothetical protein
MSLGELPGEGIESRPHVNVLMGVQETRLKAELETPFDLCGPFNLHIPLPQAPANEFPKQSHLVGKPTAPSV